MTIPNENDLKLIEKETTFKSGVDTLKGFVARPNKEGKFPAVVVIHEIYGLNDNIRNITRRLAKEGYAAMAVDLFGGRIKAVCIARAMGAMLTGKTDHFGTRDLKSALDYFSEESFVDAEHLGAIGFCMGGGFAIVWACEDKRLKTIAPFYGTNPKPIEKLKDICSVVGSYPEKDFTAKMGKKLNEVLDEQAIPHNIKIYEGAKHSFMNEDGKAYDPEAAEDAWERTLEFFKKHI